MRNKIITSINREESGYSLGIYRVAFGILMFFSVGRFIYKGWVTDCYIEPEFHFTYQYFHWISPIGGSYIMHVIAILAMIAALGIATGIKYRVSTISFFILFTYLELIEKSWYLNHYYLVSIIGFLLCFIPADSRISLKKNKNASSSNISRIYRTALKLQISIVYIYAGLAKIHSDWILNGMPLKIWLKAKVDIPYLGSILAYDETAHIASILGLIYDLSIPFLLWNKRTRLLGIAGVIVFHVITAIIFPIGMFPWIMIAGSLVFITDDQWRKFLKYFNCNLDKPKERKSTIKPQKWVLIVIGTHFIIQLILPIRHLYYSESRIWTERHYRFSWNVMLAEKTGSATYTIVDNETNKKWKEYPDNHLTTIQSKQMSYQADMIWQYAQFLRNKYKQKGISSISIYVDNWVSYNGRPSIRYIPDDLDLLTVTEDNIYNHISDLPESSD